MYTLLVFAHLLSASMALGAIVATDLRLLAKFSQDKVRIAPPNAFVARMVMLALLLLWTTGSLIVWVNLQERADFLSNPKLVVKIGLVVLLTLNAFVLHKLTFPRLAKGRRVARWTATDWIVVGVPVALSNALWLFIAFLGVAREWNDTMPMRDVLEIAAAIYLVTQVGVFALLATAARRVEPERLRWADRVARSLAALASLGVEPVPEQSRSRRVRPESDAPLPSRPRRSRAATPPQPAASLPAAGPPATSLPAAKLPPAGLPPTAAGRPPKQRPALRLVDSNGQSGEPPRERANR